MYQNSFSMERKFTLAFLLCLGISAEAQLMNGGFEAWTGQVPDGWTTNNIAPLNVYVISQTTDVHSGSFAAKGEVLDVNGTAIPPILMSMPNNVTQAPSMLSGWYKFNPATPTMGLIISITVNDAGDQLVGYGLLQVNTAASSYTEFFVPLDYTGGSGNPAAYYTISILPFNGDGGEPSLGTTFHVDDLSVDMMTAIEEASAITSFAIGDPRPNPVVNSSFLDLKFDEAQQLRAVIFDRTGREVEVLFDRNFAPGEHLIEWVPATGVANGTYFVRFIGNNGIVVKPLVLQR